jgi:hypothetical protein
MGEECTRLLAGDRCLALLWNEGEEPDVVAKGEALMAAMAMNRCSCKEGDRSRGRGG